MSIFQELKRRNVFRVGIAYAVATWLLIQVTDIVFPRIGLPDSAVTLVIALLVIGFVPALIFAWAFEMTPDGIKKEADVDRTQSIMPKTGRKLDRLIIAALVLLIFSMIAERFWFSGNGSGSISPQTAQSNDQPDTEKSNLTPDLVGTTKSVAVLPFTAMSSGEDDGYFADGLTEEILNSLTALPELLVTARTSSFHFKGKNLPIPEIAATLGVDHVVEGSVRKSGNRVRITAQLIRADDGFHLWSSTYDRTLDDVFAVQEDIASNIAQTLDVVLNDDKREKMKRAGIGNVEAFIAYQKGLEMLERAHASKEPINLLPEANQYFDQALAIVPAIVDAQLERTDLFGHMIYDNARGKGDFTPAQLESALEEIRSGLLLAARYARSDAQRAYFEAERALFSDNWSGIPANLDRAFQSNECYSVNWAATLAGIFGWATQISDHYERLMRCDPLSGINVAMGGQALLWAGQAEKTIDVSNQYLNTAGFSAWVVDIRFLATLATGANRNDPSTYDANSGGSFLQVPRSLYAYALDNDISTARELLESARKNAAVDDMTLLTVEAVLGNRDAANAYASKLDARYAGPFILAEIVKSCFCGAPFDLDATPNFKARIKEAGFHWPPPSPIKYPAKDW